jgi:peptidoglycan DL-endopeptidase CwlO
VSKSITAGRHRATPVRTSPLETISKAVSANAGTVGRQGAVIAAATGLVLTAAIPAQAVSADRSVDAPARVQVEAVQASAAVKLTFERAGITSTPAPQTVVQAVSNEISPTTGNDAASDKGQSTKKAGEAAASGAAGAIVAAAYGQIGVGQDCTALVENALRAAGYSVGDLAPAQFFAYGTQVSTPQPGDIIYYANGGAGVAHVAIYVGNGQAVHGGWAGYSTVLGSAYIGSGPVFIRPAG